MALKYKEQFENQPQPQAAGAAPRALVGKYFSAETGFARYLDAAGAAALVRQGRAVRGRLVVPARYGAGYVAAGDGAVTLPDAARLNRALPGDDVVVLLEAVERESVQLAEWRLDGPSNESGGDPTASDRDCINNVFTIGTVVWRAEREPVELECLPALQQEGAYAVQMRPIDKRYPLIDVQNKFSRPLPSNQIQHVKIDMWGVGQRRPAGVITRPGRTITLDSLDEICDFCLQSSGIEYTCKPGAIDQAILDQIAQYEDDLCRMTGLPREKVFDLADDQLVNIEELAQKAGRECMKHCPDRADFTDKLIFTIDPDTARDFDDAVHVDVITADGPMDMRKVCERCKSNE